jgi:hypothetical protein
MHSRFELRLFEWMTSLMMIGIALTIMFDSRTIQQGGFYLIQNVGLTPDVLGILFTVGGAVRMLALRANGVWPIWGPRLRASCALGGALIWCQMGIALVKWSASEGYLSIGCAVYFVLALGELISCWRAGFDMHPFGNKAMKNAGD